MSALDEARAYLEAASLDLETLAGMVARPPFPDRSMGLFAQQCIEKCAKCWLAIRRIQVQPTHNIRSLLEALANDGADTTAWLGLRRYTPYAGWVRYGDQAAEADLPPINPTIALESARNFHRHVSALLATAEASEGQP